MVKVTEGSIWKNALLFAIPIILGAFFQHLYLIVDTIIISKYIGTEALSAVGGSASKIITLLINFFIGVSIGITSLSSRYFGNKNYLMLQKVLLNGIILFTISGAILSCIGIIFIDSILIAMNTPQIEFAKSYLTTYLYGLVFCILYNVLAGVLRSLGDSKTPFYILIISSLVNLLLNLLFFFVFKWEITGIALATIIAQAISALSLAFILIKQLQKHTDFSWDINLPLIQEIFSLGIPVGFQSIMYSLLNILIQSSINTFDFITIASWVTYLRIDNIIDIFVTSITSTVLTFVGQNHGAKLYDRVSKAVTQIMTMSFIITSFIITIVILSKDPLLSLFTNNKDIIQLSSHIMFIVLPMYILSIPQWIYTQALRGVGNTFVPMLISLVGIVGFRILWIMFVVPQNPSIYLLGLGYPINSILLSILFYFYYHYYINKSQIDSK